MALEGVVRVWTIRKKESSFSEEKEAKRLLSMKGERYRQHTPNG
jgi:hypothetical protein